MSNVIINMSKKRGGCTMKKLLILLFSVLLVAGCSNGEKADTNKVEKESKQEVKSEKPQAQVQKQEKQAAQDVKSNEDLTKKLEGEKEVAKGNVYEKDDVVYSTFIVNEGTKEKEVTELVDKYAKQLQESYKDKKINVQAVKDGQVVKEQTISVKDPVVEKGQKLAKDLNAEVVNVIVGVYAIKVDLKEAKMMNATEKSQLVLQLSDSNSITIDFKPEGNAFIGTIQGNYTKDDILNGVISVK